MWIIDKLVAVARWVAARLRPKPATALTLTRWDRGNWLAVATFGHDTPLGEVLAALNTAHHNYRLACPAREPGWYTNLHICATK